MLITIASMVSGDYDPNVLDGKEVGYYHYLYHVAQQSDRGRWLLEHCQNIETASYTLSSYQVDMGVNLVGELEDGRLVTEYMLKYR